MFIIIIIIMIISLFTVASMVQRDKVHGPNGRLVDAAPPAIDQRHV